MRCLLMIVALVCAVCVLADASRSDAALILFERSPASHERYMARKDYKAGKHAAKYNAKAMKYGYAGYAPPGLSVSVRSPVRVERSVRVYHYSY